MCSITNQPCPARSVPKKSSMGVWLDGTKRRFRLHSFRNPRRDLNLFQRAKYQVTSGTGGGHGITDLARSNTIYDSSVTAAASNDREFAVSTPKLKWPGLAVQLDSFLGIASLGSICYAARQTDVRTGIGVRPGSPLVDDVITAVGCAMREALLVVAHRRITMLRPCP